MSIGLLFWIVFVVWVVFGFYRSYADRYAFGYHGVIAVLIFLLGWAEFGFVIHR